MKYCMVIQWSDEDDAYVATLPEFGPFARTHGRTYPDAAARAVEALEALIETDKADGTPLPKPLTLRRLPRLPRLDNSLGKDRAKVKRAVGARVSRGVRQGP